eukprot:c28075_g1_i1 orf=234-1871(+)
MGNWSEYRTRLQSMHGYSGSPFKRKKCKVRPETGFLHHGSAFLGLFEQWRKGLAWGSVGGGRSRSRASQQGGVEGDTPVGRVGTPQGLPALSPLPRLVQGPHRDSSSFREMGLFLSRATGDEATQNQVLRHEEAYVPEIEGRDVRNGFLLQATDDDKFQNTETQTGELESYRRNVEAVEQRDHDLTFPIASSAFEAKDRHSCELEQTISSAGPGSVCLAEVPAIRVLNAGIVSVQSMLDEQSQTKEPKWKELHALARLCDQRRDNLQAEIERTESKLTSLRVTREEWVARSQQQSQYSAQEDDERRLSAAFVPLSADEEEDVHNALFGHSGCEVLVMHEKSNISIQRFVMRCLLPGGWLHDEVINLYFELLKERQIREPKDCLKCHFFNTFFYNKLFKDKHSYDFRSVRRWTTHKKLGYNLLDCDKVFVPIHKDIHWCLAIINVREKKLEYLDSLKGQNVNTLKILGNYIADEAKDKLGQYLDVSDWKLSFPQDIPEQLNGCDCGMFMVKYVDFHSRGAPLEFSQEHMGYFRRRMVLELLRLKVI